MTDATTEPAANRRRGGRGTLIAALIVALLGAGGSYYAVASGLIPLGKPALPALSRGAAPETAFIALEPLMITLESGDSRHQLRFTAQIEVAADARREVEGQIPRIIDVLNVYLRALGLQDLRDPLALTRIRGQMLRRIQVIVGDDRIRDLLVMEFMLN